MEKRHDFIRILPDKIEYGHGSWYKIESSGMYSWWIPSFDLFFSSMTLEDGQRRGDALTQSFFNYWILQEGFDAFIDKIERLGFKTESTKQIRSLKKRRSNKPVVFMPQREKAPGEYTGYSIFSQKSIRA